MGNLSSNVRRSLTALALGSLAGCGEPAWRDPATAHGSAELASDVMEARAETGAAIRSSGKAQHAARAPRPAYPAWAGALIDKPLRRFFTAAAPCQGNTDNIKVRYLGPAGGSLLVGWGWDPATRKPPPRIILVDRDLLIVGAGESGFRRRDVPRVVPGITSQTTGWRAVTYQTSGPVTAYGLVGDGKALCRLGHVDL